MGRIVQLGISTAVLTLALSALLTMPMGPILTGSVGLILVVVLGIWIDGITYTSAEYRSLRRIFLNSQSQLWQTLSSILAGPIVFLTFAGWHWLYWSTDSWLDAIVIFEWLALGVGWWQINALKLNLRRLTCPALLRLFVLVPAFATATLLTSVWALTLVHERPVIGVQALLAVIVVVTFALLALRRWRFPF